MVCVDEGGLRCGREAAHGMMMALRDNGWVGVVQMAYFGAWTIGGPATILLLSPDDKSMEEVSWLTPVCGLATAAFGPHATRKRGDEEMMRVHLHTACAS